MIRRLPVTTTLLLVGCYYQYSYDHSASWQGKTAQEIPRPDVYVYDYDVEAYRYDQRAESPRTSFGYATIGWLAHADYIGDLDLEKGEGWRVSLPPLAVIGATYDALMAGFVVIVVGAAIGGGGVPCGGGDLEDLFIPLDPELFTSGVRGPRPLLSEVSWELTLEGSEHGADEAFRVLAGLKVATNRARGTRAYGCGGWSWHWLELSGLEDIHASGPYVGGGLDLFLSEQSSIGFDGRWHWVSAEGLEESRLLTAELSLSLHW